MRTPLKLFYSVSLVGNNGAGACTATGVGAGDQVVLISGAPTAGGALAAYRPGVDFEQFATSANQIRQLSATNLSASTLIAVCIPNAL